MTADGSVYDSLLVTDEGSMSSSREGSDEGGGMSVSEHEEREEREADVLALDRKAWNLPQPKVREPGSRGHVVLLERELPEDPAGLPELDSAA